MSTDSSLHTEAWLTEHGIDEVEAVIPDMAGVPRGKFFPARKFLKHNLRLPESVFLQGITWAECAPPDGKWRRADACVLISRLLQH
jgi:glutamine synthetase